MSFIRKPGIDVQAAYERREIIKEASEDLQRKLNRTNTSDIAGKLAGMYEAMFVAMEEIVKEEKQLMIMGE